MVDDKIVPYVRLNDYLNCRVSNIVQVKDELVVLDGDKHIVLEIDIIADLRTIPEEYHEIFLNMLTTKYMGKVNFGNNPFSQCKKIEKKKWWKIF